MKPRPQKWAQFLPEIGEPLLTEMKRITAMEQEAREARKAVMRSIRERWTPKEILAAKYAADARTLTEAF